MPFKNKKLSYKAKKGDLCTICRKGKLEKPNYCKRRECNCLICKTCKVANF